LLFSLFKRVNLVEKVGSGISRMRGEMKKAGLPLPKFEFTNFFTVTFKRPKTTPKTTLKTTLKTDDKILALIKQNQQITKEELAKQLSITIDGIKYHIKKLKKDNTLGRIGSKKAGYWEIIKKNKRGKG